METVDTRTLDFYADPANCGQQHYIHKMARELQQSRAALDACIKALEAAMDGFSGYALDQSRAALEAARKVK